MNETVDTVALVERARDMYADDDIEIDENARVSVADDGFWVQAWVWVPTE